MSLGTKKKKKLYRLTGMGPQIVLKILNDENWVMMPNECEKLSDEWWVMSDEWWKLSDGKSESKLALSDHLFIKTLPPHKKQKSVHQNLNCLNPTEGFQLSDLVSTIYMCVCIYIILYW